MTTNPFPPDAMPPDPFEPDPLNDDLTDDGPDGVPEPLLRLVKPDPLNPATDDDDDMPGPPGTDLARRDAETVELVPAIEGVPVDPDARGDTTVPWTWADTRPDPASRIPILPRWLLNPGQRRAVLSARWDLAKYTAAFHAVRVPKYAAKTAWYAPRGALRTLKRIGHWAAAEEGNWQLRQHAATTNDAFTWQSLNRTRSKESRARWWLVIPAFLAVTIGLLVLWALHLAPTWAWWTAATVLALVMARVGRPADKPITDRVSTGPRFVKLTGDMVRRALLSLGFAAMKEPDSIKFAHPGVHRDGPGWLARVDLPEGLTAVKVLDKRPELSSALRLPIDQIWPAAGPDHAGQLDLWVGYLPQSRMGAARWSLVTSNKPVSVFEPVPFAHDERLREICTVFFQRNYILGGQPGSGKTTGGRALVGAALLDPTVEMWLAAFKPAEDFYDISPFCTRYVCGLDDATMEAAEKMVADGLREVQRRQTLLGKLKRAGRIREGRTDADLARAGLGLHPLFLVFDEVHELFLSSPKAAADMIRLVKQGRSAGVIVILITQVASKDSVPPEITRCVSSRWCMSVADQVANDQIMGTGAYKRGLSGTPYRPEIDAGWGVTDGMAGAYHGPARAYYPNEKELAALLDRIRTVRAGTTPVTVIDEQPRRSILADALAVLRDRETGAHWEILAERLADIDPSYRGITAGVVSARVRAEGVESVDVKMPRQRTARKGARRADLTAALRNNGAEDGGSAGPAKPA